MRRTNGYPNLAFPVSKQQMNDHALTIVAIMKAEERFVDEWVAYHRILGAEHFIIYDDDDKNPLGRQLTRYGEFVTVVPWGKCKPQGMANNQLAAYQDALAKIKTSWVAFIDADEFIVLRKHANIQEFLTDYREFSAVLMNWHVFGHNGYFNNPPGLIVRSLLRRKATPSERVKSLVKVQAIREISSPHIPTIKSGCKKVDPNKINYSDRLYPGKTDVAHINHYVCRSFENWMSRVDRGDVFYNEATCPDRLRWRFSRDETLKRFVKNSKETNELVDDFMVRYAKPIRAFIADYKSRENELPRS